MVNMLGRTNEKTRALGYGEREDFVKLDAVGKKISSVAAHNRASGAQKRFV